MVLIKFAFLLSVYSWEYLSEEGMFLTTFPWDNISIAEGLEVGFTFRHKLMI